MVQVENVRVDGGVFRLTTDQINNSKTSKQNSWHPVLWDYRPRNFGPLSFAM
jgi:hypothetical protein